VCYTPHAMGLTAPSHMRAPAAQVVDRRMQLGSAQGWTREDALAELLHMRAAARRVALPVMPQRPPGLAQLPPLPHAAELSCPSLVGVPGPGAAEPLPWAWQQCQANGPRVNAPLGGAFGGHPQHAHPHALPPHQQPFYPHGASSCSAAVAVAAPSHAPGGTAGWALGGGPAGMQPPQAAPPARAGACGPGPGAGVLQPGGLALEHELLEGPGDAWDQLGLY
jgi:hypothetical protein